VRRGPLRNLPASIADKRVVEPLIEAIPDLDIGHIPEEGLRKLTRTKWGGWEDLPEQQRDRAEPGYGSRGL